MTQDNPTPRPPVRACEPFLTLPCPACGQGVLTFCVGSRDAGDAPVAPTCRSCGESFTLRSAFLQFDLQASDGRSYRRDVRTY